ncbi:MAG TPA: 3-hydroxyacyl-ACP dehydratase [Ferruginibacter sp.]|jgi:3-hydroxymyristoyl/3-hydroxydecanoyl-(acyl carrier protein) dehydratase|nr:3-hydroxyacyl-ACP dehydratase [Ferruginibacter sp.]
MITSHDINDLIPQKFPFVMIDKLLSYSESTISTGFTITADNIFVENGQFKEPGLVENIAQTAAARAGYVSKMDRKPVLVGYIGAVNDLQVFSLPQTGDELITEITIENQIFDVTLISGRITCKEQLVAQCRMKIFINQLKNP